jgi:hypothetical protein
MKSLALRASMGPEGAAPLIISKKAVTPTAMGETMGAKESKAMVEMVKVQASTRQAKPGGSSSSAGWLSRTFKSDKDYEKHRAEFVEEIKKLASLRHQCVITM